MPIAHATQALEAAASLRPRAARRAEHVRGRPEPRRCRPTGSPIRPSTRSSSRSISPSRDPTDRRRSGDRAAASALSPMPRRQLAASGRSATPSSRHGPGILPFGLRHCWKGHFVRELDAAAIERRGRRVHGTSPQGHSFLLLEAITGEPDRSRTAGPRSASAGPAGTVGARRSGRTRPTTRANIAWVRRFADVAPAVVVQRRRLRQLRPGRRAGGAHPGRPTAGDVRAPRRRSSAATTPTTSSGSTTTSRRTRTEAGAQASAASSAAMSRASRPPPGRATSCLTRSSASPRSRSQWRWRATARSVRRIVSSSASPPASSSSIACAQLGERGVERQGGDLGVGGCRGGGISLVGRHVAPRRRGLAPAPDARRDEHTNAESRAASTSRRDEERSPRAPSARLDGRVDLALGDANVRVAVAGGASAGAPDDRPVGRAADDRVAPLERPLRVEDRRAPLPRRRGRSEPVASRAARAAGSAAAAASRAERRPASARSTLRTARSSSSPTRSRDEASWASGSSRASARPSAASSRREASSVARRRRPRSARPLGGRPSPTRPGPGRRAPPRRTASAPGRRRRSRPA